MAAAVLGQDGNGGFSGQTRKEARGEAEELTERSAEVSAGSGTARAKQTNDGDLRRPTKGMMMATRVQGLRACDLRRRDVAQHGVALGPAGGAC